MDVRTLINKHTNGKPIPQQTQYLNEWASWYRGDVKNFHNYTLFNGEVNIDIRRKSMQFAKYICETWADLLLNERCDIIVPEKQKEILDNIWKRTNFWVKANQGVEKSWALSYGALVVGVKGLEIGNKGTLNKKNARVGIDFVDAFKVHPITVENKEVIEVAFESKNSDSVNVVFHMLENGKYVITNYVINSEGIVSSYQFNTGSDQAWFQILQPNIANNLNDNLSDDELGISIFANSIDGLKDLDSKYDSFYEEYILGRKKVFLSTKAYRIDTVSGEKVRTYDPYDNRFYYLQEDDDGKKKIDTVVDQLRSAELISGINAQLNYTGMKCGFGQAFFRFDGTGPATATQVISENSTLYRNIKKHEILLESVLFGITKAVIYVANNFTDTPVGELKDEDITIQFDDSIIEDKQAEMERDKADVAAGLLSKEEYRVKWYGETEDEAIENVNKYFLYEKINNYSSAVTLGLMTPTQFVDEVYGEVENKQEIIDYITDYIGKGDTFDLYNGEGGVPEEEPEEQLEQ